RGIARALALAQDGTPEPLVGELAPMPEDERRELAAWSENPRRHEGAEPVDRLVARPAAARPAAPAGVFGERPLSYGE
ncbi:hypothetical protein ACEN8K_47710, partial [Variovorax sp. CT11-76]